MRTLHHSPNAFAFDSSVVLRKEHTYTRDCWIHLNTSCSNRATDSLQRFILLQFFKKKQHITQVNAPQLFNDSKRQISIRVVLLHTIQKVNFQTFCTCSNDSKNNSKSVALHFRIKNTCRSEKSKNAFKMTSQKSCKCSFWLLTTYSTSGHR